MFFTQRVVAWALGKSKTKAKQLDCELLLHLSFSRDFSAKALELEPLLLINSVVKEVTLFNDKIIITYNNPTNNGSDFDSQGRLFYSKTVTLKSIANYKTVPQYNKVVIEMAV